MPIQAAATAATTQPARITNGFVGCGGRVTRRPPDLPRAVVDRDRLAA
ncbi:MAG TPA: hypothetical protein VMR00_06125 [Streptosporangiaceae bacterium]|nr:hypothetical protein [Streptosporangiaceae bacterium]